MAKKIRKNRARTGIIKSNVIRGKPSRAGYQNLLVTVSDLLEKSLRGSARVINSFMTATYWEIGRRIVEFEQRGKKRAEYGQTVLERLSKDLTRRHGRGFAQFVRQCRTNWRRLNILRAHFECLGHIMYC